MEAKEIIMAQKKSKATTIGAILGAIPAMIVGGILNIIMKGKWRK